MRLVDDRSRDDRLVAFGAACHLSDEVGKWIDRSRTTDDETVGLLAAHASIVSAAEPPGIAR